MSETPARRVSTRNRGEPPLKKRALTPPAPPPQRAQPATGSAPAPAPPIEPTENGLPMRLKEGHPLPTLAAPQDTDLPTKDFQTISESGILAASIERSRQKWVSDGVFDRYWSKPNKKKAPDETQNPPKETMSRLGACSMIIEPHAFEVTLYTVKDLQTAYQRQSVQPPPLSNAQYNPFSQPSAFIPPSYHTPHTESRDRPDSSQPTLPSFGEAFGQFGPQRAPPIPHPPFNLAPPVTASNPPSLSRTNSGHEPSQDNGPNSDPVIQMLATRAASDHDLKALMKVVASGKASSEQLKDFQNHIDELNTILKSRGSSKTPNEDDDIQKPPAPESEIFSAHAETAPRPSSPHVTTAGPAAPIDKAVAPMKTEASIPYYPPLHQPLPQPPKAKALTYKPEIHSIVFDFGGTGDRFLFPRFSIIEYLPGGTQVVVSFLMISKRGPSMSGKYKETRTYYQPITMRLSAQNPRTLEPLARIVATPDEVRKYMDEVFNKMSPAENVYLPLRLPRAKDAEKPEKEESPMAPGSPLIKRVYSPPNSLAPLASSLPV